MLGFLFNGFFTGHAEHTSWIYSFAALPWIIWRLDAAILRHSTRAAAEAGALWGLSAMAGYPGVVMATAMTASLWLLGRAIFPMRLARNVRVLAYPILPPEKDASPHGFGVSHGWG